MTTTKLSGLQRQACLAVICTVSTTPSAVLEILLDLLPIHVYLERETRWITCRLQQAAISMIIFQTEIYSIESCVWKLDQMPPTYKSIKICLDSQEALKAPAPYRCNFKIV